jgi:predicted nuclease of predicted toxin-antitoxin system
MWSFLVDESMPRSTALVLRQAGYPTEDARDVGLRGHNGHNDEDVYRYAQAQRLTIITADKDFANALRFPPGTHQGIIVVRIPDEQPTQAVLDELRRTLTELEGGELAGLLVIVERGRTRIRRPPGPTA